MASAHGRQHVCDEVSLVPLAFGALAYRKRVNFNQFVGIALALGGLIALPLEQQQGKWLLMAIVVGALAAFGVKRGSRGAWKRARAETTASSCSNPRRPRQRKRSGSGGSQLKGVLRGLQTGAL
jgi:hypothetical protein